MSCKYLALIPIECSKIIIWMIASIMKVDKIMLKTWNKVLHCLIRFFMTVQCHYRNTLGLHFHIFNNNSGQAFKIFQDFHPM